MDIGRLFDTLNLTLVVLSNHYVCTALIIFGTSHNSKYQPVTTPLPYTLEVKLAIQPRINYNIVALKIMFT